jgi:hypothetical protein
MKAFKLSLILAVTAILPGCKVADVHEGAGGGVRVRDSRVPQAGIRYNTVVILDKSLENWNGKVFDPPLLEYFWPQEKKKRSKIAVESTNSRRTETGTLEAWAILRNRTDHDLQLEGRTQFFDADKAPAENPTAWQRIFLPPQSVATYKDSSTKIDGIGYYYVEIREGR